MKFRRPRFQAYRGVGLERDVKALGWTSCFQDIASEMVYPLLPQFVLLLGGGAMALGVIESVAEGVLAIFKGAAGAWSDRAGRRKPFVSAGYGLSALTRPIMAVAAAPFHVGLLRSLDRLAKGLRTAPRDAVIGEVTPVSKHAAAFSFHRGLDHLGAAIGPLVAAGILYLAPGHLRLVFVAATIPALAGWAIAQFGVREPQRVETKSTSPAPRKAVPARLKRPLAAFFIFSLGNASDAFLILRADQLGWSPIQITLLWSVFHVAKWLVSAPGGRVADRIGPRRALLAGWSLYIVAYLGFGVTASTGPVILLLGIYALYYGLAEGAERALILAIGGPELGAGRTLGAFHLASGLGTFAASMLFGAIWELQGPSTAFLTGAVLAGLAGFVLGGRER